MMHERLEKEFNRIFDVLTQTHPATDDYCTVIQSFEMLDSVGPTINTFLYAADHSGAIREEANCHEDCADCLNCAEPNCAEPSGEQPVEDNVVEFPTPVPETHPTEEAEVAEQTPVKAEEKPALSASEVRAKLAAARRAGVNVAAIIKEFGADNFTALPANKYSDLLDRIESESAGLE